MALDVIQALVQRFSNHLDEYKSGGCNEIRFRRDFLDPFFEVPGGFPILPRINTRADC